MRMRSLSNLEMQDRVDGKLTTAMQFSILKELIAQLDIPIEDFKAIASNGINLEEQEKAIKNVGIEINQINEAFQTEIKTFSELVASQFTQEFSPNINEENLQASTTTKVDANTDATNTDTITIEAPIEVDENIATVQEVRDIVIPLIVLRLKNNGVVNEENKTIAYESEKYLAVAKTENDVQFLRLEKIIFDCESSKEIVLASKDNNSDAYNVTVNNLSKKELEHFKALFLKTFEKTKTSLNTGKDNNQLSKLSEKNDKEIG
ncbi:hypothetical protein C7B70_15430 [Chlorogloea sp. CCALA 695]|nr:hypothetical protein C7B70_15430 [Chlorogloea sp. CCALA 695]